LSWGASPWYYSGVQRRLVLAVTVLLLATACGKKVPVAPGGKAVSVSASELQGLASYYAEPYHGRRTASGEIFDSYQELTAAHRTLPFNTVVRVTNQENGKDVEVRINDRGPFVDGRVIDLSQKAAREIDMVRSGTARVKLTVLNQASSPAASRTPATPSGPASSPPSSAAFTVQVGAFESREVAEALKRDLEQRHQDVTIETFSTTRTFYRVRVGRLSDMAAAEQLVRMLRQEKLDPFVVRLN
jgi:rare lipoprotein A